MPNQRSPYNVLTAFRRMWDDLPDLVGNEWGTVGPAAQSKLEQMRSSHEQAQQFRLADDLVALIEPYAAAMARFSAEIEMQARITSKLADSGLDEATIQAAYYALGWSIETEIKAANSSGSDDSGFLRHITLVPGAFEETKSRKLSNLRLDLNELVPLVSSVALTGYELLSQPDPIPMTIGTLVIVSSLNLGITQSIPEDTACVFWGFIQARDEHNQATEEEILQSTNLERAKYGYPTPLSEFEFKKMLKELEKLGSIRWVDGTDSTWKIIETYTVNYQP